jgi:hypothetical protein
VPDRFVGDGELIAFQPVFQRLDAFEERGAFLLAFLLVRRGEARVARVANQHIAQGQHGLAQPVGMPKAPLQQLYHQRVRLRLFGEVDPQPSLSRGEDGAVGACGASPLDEVLRLIPARLLQQCDGGAFVGVRVIGVLFQMAYERLVGGVGSLRTEVFERLVEAGVPPLRKDGHFLAHEDGWHRLPPFSGLGVSAWLWRVCRVWSCACRCCPCWAAQAFALRTARLTCASRLQSCRVPL